MDVLLLTSGCGLPLAKLKRSTARLAKGFMPTQTDAAREEAWHECPKHVSLERLADLPLVLTNTESPRLSWRPVGLSQAAAVAA
ncbi:hypothetical protein GmRootV213_05840 [Variovorax sp. V213]